MSELPDNVDLRWLGRRLIGLADDVKALRGDMDILTRIIVRLDRNVDAIREDIRTLWGSNRDLRDRIDRLETRLDRLPITDTD